MTLDELRRILAALMADGHYKLAGIVREVIDARTIARDAILDHIHRQE